MKLVSIILRIVVGITFIVSAVAKLYPIEPFEIIFVDLGISNWFLAPFLARLVVVIELVLGLSILFNTRAKNAIYYLAQGALILFTSYLIFLLITKGNDVDCGCFGSWLALSPLSSILKNGVLFLFLFLIKKENYNKGLQWVFPLLFLLIALPTVFALNRVGLQNTQAKALNELVDLSRLPLVQPSQQSINYTKGNKVLVFLSIGCNHCKSLAYKLAVLTKNKPSNVYLVIGSLKEENLQPFFDETKLELPYVWMGDDTFYKYSGGKLPAIIYIEEGFLKKKWTGEFVDLEELAALFEY